MSEAPPAPSTGNRALRGVLFLLFAAVVATGVGGYLYWRSLLGVSTDDAYLRADIVQVPAEVSGRIVSVSVIENQHVHQGDVLMQVDDADYALRVAQAEANLAAARFDAERAEKAAQLTRSDTRKGEVRLADAKRELGLQEELVSGGASVKAVVDRAAAMTAMAQQDVASAQVAIAAADVSIHAAKSRVEAAEAAVAVARRDQGLTLVHAPCDGVASKVDLQPGELVQRGQAALAIVADARYVVANFKETDLARIHPGDAVEIDIDAFPAQPLVGTVDSVGAGTGSIFSLIPADNASGNFIKVVQRVPVRILVADQAAATAMPAGLSANVLVKSAR